MPHCDPSILHAPGKCWACDKNPDWQQYRRLAGIAFTAEPDECGVEPNYESYSKNRYEPGKAPCPSTWFREPRARDQWGPNVAQGQVYVEG